MPRRGDMANIAKLYPGQIVYETRRERAGNTMMARTSVYHVEIVSVDIATGIVTARWNNNSARPYSGRIIKKWKVNKPIPKG